MNRRVNDRRRTQRDGISRERKGVKASRRQFYMLVLSLIMSAAAIGFSIRNQISFASFASMTTPVQVGTPEAVKPTETEKSVEAAKPVEISKPKRSHRPSKTRISKATPKRVTIVFEESVARAPASEPAVTTQRPKVIRDTNDLYEKEDQVY